MSVHVNEADESLYVMISPVPTKEWIQQFVCSNNTIVWFAFARMFSETEYVYSFCFNHGSTFIVQAVLWQSMCPG